jgi:hypothetical protein
MPARAEEIHHAKAEGVRFMPLHNPVEFVGNESGYLAGVKLIRMELGDADESGRRRPLEIEGSEFVMPVDVAIIAVGTGANPIVQSSTSDMQTNKWEPSWRTRKRCARRNGASLPAAISSAARPRSFWQRVPEEQPHDRFRNTLSRGFGVAYP